MCSVPSMSILVLFVSMMPTSMYIQLTVLSFYIHVQYMCIHALYVLYAIA